MSWQRVNSSLAILLGTTCLVASIATVAVWLVGIVCSDRWEWSQWLSWIPSLVLIPAGLMWLAGTLMVPRLRRTRAWIPGPTLLLAGSLIFFTVNWQPASTRNGEHHGITITQWTLGSVLTDEEAYASALIDTGSQVCIVEGARRLRWSQLIKDWLGPGNHAPSTGIFSVMTRLPVATLRSSIWAEGIHVALLELNGPGFEQIPLSILLVDLPSDPSLGRWKIAQKLQALLEQADTGTYDLVMGDFNMPADSAALATLFPGYTPAWTTSGEGWGPTFPRAWAVARIDHVLVSDHMQVSELRTIDPGVGRHRLQVMRVSRRPGGDVQGTSAEE